MRQVLFSLLVWAVLPLVQAVSTSGSRVLVVLDSDAEKAKYSQFLADLEGRGYTLKFSQPKQEPALLELGELAHDHLLLLPTTSKGLGPSLTPQLLLDFIKKDGNILLALSGKSSTPSAVTSLLLELDINLAPARNAAVIDHFNFDTISAAEAHDVLVLPQPTPKRKDVKSFFGGDGVLAVPRAVGQILGNTSPLLVPILSAPSTAYSYDAKEEADSSDDFFGSGSQISIVSALQARNSARFTVLGSAEMLEDAWFDASVKAESQKSKSKTANREFVKALSAWTFKELGVLKVGRLQHYLNEGSSHASGYNASVSQVDLNPKMYRIKNEVTYMIEVSEYSYDHWEPYTPPAGDDIQLEFTMLSPFHRLQLQPVSQTSTSTLYSTTFRLPDQHGIFNFRVNYKRPFLTSIDRKDTVTVRHFAHDEWPRSFVISGAYVWIAGIWITIAGFVAFVAVWLYSEPATEEKRTKKTQ